MYKLVFALSTVCSQPKVFNFQKQECDRTFVLIVGFVIHITVYTILGPYQVFTFLNSFSYIDKIIIIINLFYAINFLILLRHGDYAPLIYLNYGSNSNT